MPFPLRQFGTFSNQRSRFDEQFDVVFVRVLDGNPGGLHDDLQSPLKTRNIGSQTDKSLEVDISEYSKRPRFTTKRRNPM